MKTKNSIIMVSKLFFISIIILTLIYSCSNNIDVNENNRTDKTKEYDKYNMGDILSKCKGHIVVVGKGFNSGNREEYQNYLIIKDDSSNMFVYIGAKFDLNKGDTLR